MSQVTRSEFEALKKRVDGVVELANGAHGMVTQVREILERFQVETNSKIDAFINEHNAKIDDAIEQLDAQDTGDAWKRGAVDDE